MPGSRDKDSVSASDARNNLPEMMNRAAYAGARFILTRRGRNVAALVSAEDLELLEALEDRIDAIEVRAALRDADENSTEDWEEVKRELDL